MFRNEGPLPLTPDNPVLGGQFIESQTHGALAGAELIAEGDFAGQARAGGPVAIDYSGNDAALDLLVKWPVVYQIIHGYRLIPFFAFRSNITPAFLISYHDPAATPIDFIDCYNSYIRVA